MIRAAILAEADAIAALLEELFGVEPDFRDLHRHGGFGANRHEKIGGLFFYQPYGLRDLGHVFVQRRLFK